jgi:glycogen/starch synthases, ADP-glucose type
MNILFATSECAPFAASGGLGDVSGSLPKALNKAAGVDCRVVMPLYSDIAPEYRKKMTQLAEFEVPVAWRSQYCGIWSAVFHGVTYYFVDNEYYFKRGALYGFFDDAERFAYFSRAVLEMLNHIDFGPDIIHANDWQTALVSVFINMFGYREDPRYYGIKTLFTIHNIQYQGKYGLELLEDVLGVAPHGSAVVEYGGCVNFIKGAIESADKINTVSPSYAQEILDPWFSHGLDQILHEREHKLSGILNGIDNEVYNPETDASIAANYSAQDFAPKAECKKSLLGHFGLETEGDSANEPIIGIVSRLVAHKGFDLVKHVLEYIILNGMKVIVLGSGEYMYENCFRDFAERYPQSCAAHIGFDPKLARMIYAGSDMFLMPSKSEPCGLSQMIALRYGTLPIVRLTGGLKDSISDSGDGKGNGFTFRSYNAHDMLDACLRAKAVYDKPEEWQALVKRALESDYSWSRAADNYLNLYKDMLSLWQ